MGWVCRNCRESIETGLTVCWNCGADQQGTVDPKFKHADLYEPDVPTASSRFGILGLAKLVAACAMIFSFFSYPDFFTFCIAMCGMIWLMIQSLGWLMTESAFAWQRRSRYTRRNH